MIHFCIPTGHPTTWGFTRSMIKLTDFLGKNHIKSRLFDHANSDVYISRNHCLVPESQGPYPTVLAEKQPFNGKLNYDFIFWIDTDMVFEPEQVMKLIDNNVDVCTGMAKVDRDNYAVGYFGQNDKGEFYFANLMARTYDVKNDKVIDSYSAWLKDKQQPNGLCEVGYCGGGFLCVKRGVYEKHGYPFYYTQAVEHGPVPIEASEDVSWSWRVTQLGYKIWADPTVQVGHEKKVELR